jgi:hypothetical protein
MGRRFLRLLAWKTLLYLVVAVVLGGVTRDLTLTVLLTVGFAAGDGSVAVLLSRAVDRTTDDRRTPVAEPDRSSTP